LLPRKAQAAEAGGVLATSSFAANTVISAGVSYVEIPQTVVRFEAPLTGRVVVAVSGAVAMAKLGYQGYFKIGGIESLVMVQSNVLRIVSRVVVENLAGTQEFKLAIRSNNSLYPVQVSSGDIGVTSYGPLTVAVIAA
jgi:hypothetical protein